MKSVLAVEVCLTLIATKFAKFTVLYTQHKSMLTSPTYPPTPFLPHHPINNPTLAMCLWLS